MLLRLALLLLISTAAAAQNPMLQALRQQDWATATRLASAGPDALAPKLVTFIRLLNSDREAAGEIAGFMAANPGWPDRPVLERRYAEALAEEPDARAAAALCRAHVPQSAPGLLRCADAFALEADGEAASRAARAAWVAGVASPELEAAFLGRWAHVPTEADQQARFDRLMIKEPEAAARQLARLGPSARPLAAARLALRLNDPDALASLTGLSAGARADPALLLAEARFLRRNHADAAALALWRTALPGAEASIPVAGRAVFWAERDALARDLLAGGDVAAAFVLADDRALGPDQAAEAAFLSGWIALRRLHDPATARVRFAALAGLSRAAITQARAQYWLGRSAADAASAKASYALGAAWPLTYYGQLAARAAGEAETALRARISGQRDPIPSAAEATAFQKSDFARAAVILAGWQDPRRAADFLQQAIQPPATLATRALAASLAIRLGVDDVAVQAARLAGRDGGVLPQAGWPVPAFVSAPGDGVSESLVLGVMRQESSFDPMIVSSAGAVGLMQIMPNTAQQLARALHAAPGKLTDSQFNMRLGTAYMASLLGRFHGSVPAAVAAYNAGAHRVDGWIAANGDPDADGEGMIDWIEMIPFAETRNYVERVLENETVYGSRLSR